MAIQEQIRKKRYHIDVGWEFGFELGLAIIDALCEQAIAF